MRMNLNVLNKYIRIVDLDKGKIAQYYKDETNHHIVKFSDLGIYDKINENNKDIKIEDYQSKDLNSDCYHSEIEKIKLPVKYLDKMTRKLNDYIKSNGTNGTITNFEYNQDDNKKLSEEVFYYFLLSLFKDYNKYLYSTESEIKQVIEIFLASSDISEIPIDSIYNAKKFLNDIKGNDENNFYYSFLKTKMFKDLLRRKYYDLNEDRFSFLFFDESIIEKKAKSFLSAQKKTKKLFIEFNQLQITHSYKCKETKDFTDVEYNYLKEHKNELINYYQSYDEENQIFVYKLFPKFLYDDIFFKPIENLLDPPLKCLNSLIIFNYKNKYNEVLSLLKDEKFYKIYKGDLTTFNLFNPYKTCFPGEMEEMLCLLWLRVFCLTFHYCESKEKIHRFYEMIKNIDKITNFKYYLHSDNIYAFILVTLEKFGTEEMVIKYLEKIKSNNYIEYCYLCNKMQSQSKSLGQIKKITVANSRISVSMYKDNKDDVLLGLSLLKKVTEQFILKQRGFNNGNGEKEIVLFGEKFKCKICNSEFSLGEYTSTLDKLTKISSFICLNCKKEFTPSITINVNGDISRINLYSPYYVYKYLSSEIINENGNKLNLDLLQEKYSDFYWNCIWYFFIRGYSYDMLIKYKQAKYEDIIKKNN